MKEPDEWSALSKLWQTGDDKQAPPLANLQARQRRQSRIMLANIIVESLMMIVLGFFAVGFLSENGDLYEQLWVGFVCGWASVLFFLINRSRWKSLRLIKTCAVSESLSEQIDLVRHEIFRWRLSAVATLIFLLVISLLFIASLVFGDQALSATGRMILAWIVLVMALVYFSWRKRAAMRMLENISA
ncbi:MAG: hypothetical protein WD600_10530 [Pseudohongiella sp.]